MCCFYVLSVVHTFIFDGKSPGEHNNRIAAGWFSKNNKTSNIYEWHAILTANFLQNITKQNYACWVNIMSITRKKFYTSIQMLYREILSYVKAWYTKKHKVQVYFNFCFYWVFKLDQYLVILIFFLIRWYNVLPWHSSRI